MEGKKEVCISLWFAVNASGQDLLFLNKPTRNETYKTWIGETIPAFHIVIGYFVDNGLSLPKLTWKDEPYELHLQVSD